MYLPIRRFSASSRIGSAGISRQTQFLPRRNTTITYAQVPSAESHLFSVNFLNFLRPIAGEFQTEFRRLLNERKKHNIYTSQVPLTYRHDLEWIRNDTSWHAPIVVSELEKRWVEITGPAGDKKMVINALNSGANCYMSDLEDSQSPTWHGIVQSHQNLYEAVRGTLKYEKNEKKAPKQLYTIKDDHATLIVRPRGLHMFEHHVVDESGRPMPAMLFDILMFMFHNADHLIKKSLRPLFYIPKLESFEEALLVHDIIQQAEAHLGISYGTCRATVLIETLPAILQAEEIGYAMGGYWGGLNCGRWDYVFSVIKHTAKDPRCVLPDRHHLNMSCPFMTSYMKRIVQVCHRRGVHAMGGMSAFVPGKDALENERILKKVSEDKIYEIAAGCDGAWVAHPSLVLPIQEVFAKHLHGAPNQIDSPLNISTIILAPEFATSPWSNAVDIEASDDIGEPVPESAHGGRESELARLCTVAGLKTNIRVGILYLASWLSGVGAVSIDGLMEDLATAEISRAQVWQWIHHNQLLSVSEDDSLKLTALEYEKIQTSVVEEIKSAIKSAPELSAARTKEKLEKIGQAAEMFQGLVTASKLQAFITDSAIDELNEAIRKPEHLRTQFSAYQFTKEEVRKLQGSQPDLFLDAKLAIARGGVFNDKMLSAVRDDGLVPHGSFIGTPNGHSARNVVEGGLGYSWPYIGGWELNARGLSGLEQPMPDTLSVNFHEQGDLARVINRFLLVADQVQRLELENKLEDIRMLPTKTERDAAERELVHTQIDYLLQPMLADLEQGWGDPKKVFYSVIRCLENGVNIMHIEDQYSLKRCGHLGGKGLDDINGWIIIMKAANLAASLFKGVHRDGPDQNVNFVARTDALSAEFIQFSEHMKDPGHLDHPFIDWERGYTPDGRYLYLKKGVNPVTGRKFGLEHSAKRCAEIVKNGLASHVWMETPDAKISDAKQFMDLVNEHLAPHGVFARGLYNHSPSFVWDVNFFLESQELAVNVADYIDTLEIKEKLDSKDPSMSIGKAHHMVKQFLKNQGDRTRGDYHFSDDYVSQILGNGIDLSLGRDTWRKQIDVQMKTLASLGPGLQTYKGQKELERIRDLGFRPLRHITNTIVAQRLKNFKDRLSNAGFECLLCTLPLYPSDAYTASRLARGMTETGIHDFVINQRLARKYADATGKLACFFHQKSTGTGYEAAINQTVGSANVDMLHGSTEIEDQRKEKLLREQGITVGKGVLTGEW